MEDALFCARRNARLNDVDDERLGLYLPWEMPSLRSLTDATRADVATANMLPGPLMSVEAELAGRVRTGGVLLLSGFREVDLPAVRKAFSPHFAVPARPTLQRDGYIALACHRTDASLRTDDLSASAVA